MRKAGSEFCTACLIVPDLVVDLRPGGEKMMTDALGRCLQCIALVIEQLGSLVEPPLYDRAYERLEP